MNRFVILLIIAAVCAAQRGSSRTNPIRDLKQNNADQHGLKSLDDDGVWVRWSSTQAGLPKYAVFAGNIDNSGASYVIRADHTTPSGTYVGKVLGKYFPLVRDAWIGNSGQEHKKTNFEVLTHKRWAWAEKGDSRQNIPGGNSFNICRAFAVAGDYWTPGSLNANTGLCSIWNNNKEQVTQAYQVLKRAC